MIALPGEGNMSLPKGFGCDEFIDFVSFCRYAIIIQLILINRFVENLKPSHYPFAIE